MALGNGTFSVQNKVLPGSYVKFISAVRANASLSERGVTALMLPTLWNPGVLVTLHPEDLAKSESLFGYAPESAELRPLREAFCSCGTVLVYTVGAGTIASCEIGNAAKAGSFGNQIRVIVSQNPDWTAVNMKMDVVTTLNGVEVDRQTGVNASVIQGEIKSNEIGRAHV